MTETTEKSLAQRLYEHHWRRSQEALPWDQLYPGLQRTWQKDVEFVTAAVQSEWDRVHQQAAHREREQLRARVAELKGLLAAARAENADLRREALDRLAMASDVLDEVKPPRQAPEGIRAWDVTVHVTAEQFAAWMELGGVPAL